MTKFFRTHRKLLAHGGGSSQDGSGIEGQVRNSALVGEAEVEAEVVSEMV